MNAALDQETVNKNDNNSWKKRRLYYSRCSIEVCGGALRVTGGFILAICLSFKVASQELGQLYDCFTGSEVTLKEIGKSTNTKQQRTTTARIFEVQHYSNIILGAMSSQITGV